MAALLRGDLPVFGSSSRAAVLESRPCDRPLLGRHQINPTEPKWFASAQTRLVRRVLIERMFVPQRFPYYRPDTCPLTDTTFRSLSVRSGILTGAPSLNREPVEKPFPQLRFALESGHVQFGAMGQIRR